LKEESEKRKVCGFGAEAPGRGVKQQLFVTYKERESCWFGSLVKH